MTTSTTSPNLTLRKRISFKILCFVALVIATIFSTHHSQATLREIVISTTALRSTRDVKSPQASANSKLSMSPHSSYSKNNTILPNRTSVSCFYQQKGIANERWKETKVTTQEFWANQSCSFNLGLNTIFFHQGKAGGGTFTKKADKYRSGIKLNHPVPHMSSVQRLMNGPLTTLIFPLRDPVDRFVSMFNWRLLTLCHPGDKRKQIRAYWKDPEQFCLKSMQQEQTLRVKYKGDPNVMAEALCKDSSKYEEAIRDARRINHSTKISKWLEFLVDPTMVKRITEKGIKNFIAIPLTSQVEDDIDTVLSNILKENYGDLIFDALPDGLNMFALQKEEKLSHSSSKQLGDDKPRGLSKLAECCLTRYYEKDYQVIQTMLGNDEGASLKSIKSAHPVLGKACDWGDIEQQERCKNNLRSMIEQRSSYISKSRDHTCSELVL